MNNPEQQPKPEKPEQPKDDLFRWGVIHSKPKDDGLGWSCPQCESLGRLCERCLAKKSPEELDSANDLLQTEGHKPKKTDEIPTEEAIEMLNQTLEDLRHQTP